MRSRAFTLIELLVVVTIIVVLLALLVPAMEKAMSVGESAVCMTNLHTWGVALRLYATDHPRASPPIRTQQDIEKLWPNFLAPYVGEPGYNNGTSRPDGLLRANRCPTTPYRPLFSTDWATSSRVGSAQTMWEFYTLQGSYGFNFWLTDFIQREPKNFHGRYNNVPGQTPIMGDSGWLGGWPDHGDIPIDRTQTEAGGGYSHEPFNLHMNRWAVARHNTPRRAINFVFVDGSSRNVPLGEMWALGWHKNSVPNHGYENAFD